MPPSTYEYTVTHDQIFPHSSPLTPHNQFNSIPIFFISPHVISTLNMPTLEYIFLKITFPNASTSSSLQFPPTIYTPVMLYPEPQLDSDEVMLNEPFLSFFTTHYSSFSPTYSFSKPVPHSATHDSKQYNAVLQSQRATYRGAASPYIYSSSISLSIPSFHQPSTFTPPKIIQIQQLLHILYNDVPLYFPAPDRTPQSSSPSSTFILFYQNNTSIIPFEINTAMFVSSLFPHPCSLSEFTFTIAPRSTNLSSVLLRPPITPIIPDQPHISTNSPPTCSPTPFPSAPLTNPILQQFIRDFNLNSDLQTQTTSFALCCQLLTSAITSILPLPSSPLSPARDDSQQNNHIANDRNSISEIIAIQGPKSVGKTATLYNTLTLLSTLSIRPFYLKFDVTALYDLLQSSSTRFDDFAPKSKSMVALSSLFYRWFMAIYAHLQRCTRSTAANSDDIGDSMGGMGENHVTQNQSQNSSPNPFFVHFVGLDLFLRDDELLCGQDGSSVASQDGDDEDMKFTGDSSASPGLLRVLSMLNDFVTSTNYILDHFNVKNTARSRRNDQNEAPANTSIPKFPRILFLFESINIAAIVQHWATPPPRIFSLSYPTRTESNLLTASILSQAFFSPQFSQQLSTSPSQSKNNSSNNNNNNNNNTQTSPLFTFSTKLSQTEQWLRKIFSLQETNKHVIALSQLPQLFLKYRHFLPAFINTLSSTTTLKSELLYIAHFFLNLSSSPLTQQQSQTDSNPSQHTDTLSSPQLSQSPTPSIPSTLPTFPSTNLLTSTLTSGLSVQAIHTSVFTQVRNLVETQPGFLSSALDISQELSTAPISAIHLFPQLILMSLSLHQLYAKPSRPSSSSTSSSSSSSLPITQQLSRINASALLISLLHSHQHNLPLPLLPLIDSSPHLNTQHYQPTPSSQNNISWDDFIASVPLKSRIQAIVRQWYTSLNLSDKTFQHVAGGNILIYGNSGNGKTMVTSLISSASAFSQQQSSSKSSSHGATNTLHAKDHDLDDDQADTIETSTSISYEQQINMNIITLNPGDVYSKYLGESERKIRRTFAIARQQSPCIIIIDNIDTIASNRESGEEQSHAGVELRVLSTLLNELDGLDTKMNNKPIFVVATCTNLSDIDPALLRSGRFDHVINIPDPDVNTMIKLFAKEAKPFLSPPQFPAFHTIFATRIAPVWVKMRISSGKVLQTIRTALLDSMMKSVQASQPL